jgi:hypothetical protein
MGLTNGSRQLGRVLSDVSGLSQEEAGLLVAGAAAVTAVLGVLRVVDVVTDLWPRPLGRARS